jgi:hypothetical protein
MNLLEIAYSLYSGLIDRIALDLSHHTAARVDDLRQKYEKTLDQDTFDYLSRNDPSGNHKYLAWMCKQSISHPAEAVVNATNVFNENLGKLSKKDLNQYPEVESIYDAIRDIARKNLASIKVYRQSKMIYPLGDEPTRWVVLTVPNHAAMKYYGTGTKWCVAQKNPRYYKSYSSEGTFFILIDLMDKSNKFAIYWKSDQRPEVWEPSDSEVGHGHLEEISGNEYKKIFDTISKHPGVSAQPWEDLKQSMEEIRNLRFDQIREKILNTPNSMQHKLITALPKRVIEQLYHDTELMADSKTRSHILKAQSPAFLDSKFDELTPQDKSDVVRRIPVRRAMSYYSVPHPFAIMEGYGRLPKGKREEYALNMFKVANPDDITPVLIKELEEDGFNFTKVPPERLKLYKSRLIDLKPETAESLRAVLGDDFVLDAQINRSIYGNKSSKNMDLSFLKTEEGRNAFRRVNEIRTINRELTVTDIKTIMSAYDIKQEPSIREMFSMRRLPPSVEKRIFDEIIKSDNMTMNECERMTVLYNGLNLEIIEKIYQRMESLEKGSFLRMLDGSPGRLKKLSPQDVDMLVKRHPELSGSRSLIISMVDRVKDVDNMILIHDQYPKYAEDILFYTLYESEKIPNYWKFLLHMCRKGTLSPREENHYVVSHLQGITPEAKAELESYADKIPFIKKELDLYIANYEEAVTLLQKRRSEGGRIMAYEVQAFKRLQTSDLFRLLQEFPEFSGAPDFGRDALIGDLDLPFSEVAKVVNWKSWNGVVKLFEKQATDQDLIPYMNHSDEDVRYLTAKKVSPTALVRMKSDGSVKVRRVVAQRAPLQDITSYLRDSDSRVRSTAQKRLGANPETGELF